MAEITVDEFQRIQIAQISAVLRGLGWSVVASDTRGDAILVTITHLMHVQSQNSPINVWYCYPGEIWIAKKLKISLATTERGVRLLRESGWIVTRRRRKKPGRGSRTQLYFPGKKMMSALKKAG